MDKRRMQSRLLSTFWSSCHGKVTVITALSTRRAVDAYPGHQPIPTPSQPAVFTSKSFKLFNSRLGSDCCPDGDYWQSATALAGPHAGRAPPGRRPAAPRRALFNSDSDHPRLGRGQSPISNAPAHRWATANWFCAASIMTSLTGNSDSLFTELGPRPPLPRWWRRLEMDYPFFGWFLSYFSKLSAGIL